MPFLSLPVEVHEAIRAQLSLPSHIRLSQTCKAFYYGIYTEKRCKLLCQRAGFSRPSQHPLDASQKVPGFKQIASAVVWHASQCQLKDCKELVDLDEIGTTYNCAPQSIADFVYSWRRACPNLGQKRRRVAQERRQVHQAYQLVQHELLLIGHGGNGFRPGKQ